MQLFDKERILRLGQQYDKEIREIHEISTHSPTYEKNREETRSYKVKNIARVRQSLQLFYEWSEGVFTQVDAARSLDLTELWGTLTYEQKGVFLGETEELRPEFLPQDVGEVPLAALEKWSPSREELGWYKRREPVIEQVQMRRDDRKMFTGE